MCLCFLVSVLGCLTAALASPLWSEDEEEDLRAVRAKMLLLLPHELSLLFLAEDIACPGPAWKSVGRR